MATKIDDCRLCNSKKLYDFLDLGMQALTGVFPQQKSNSETKGPLVLTLCEDCGLVQLRHDAPMSEMYGENYGYRSGLNKSMVSHLKDSVAKALKIVELEKSDLVIDIGSNDGTLLGFYPQDLSLQLVGVDPVGTKFKEFYQERIQLVPEFFPSPSLEKVIENKKARVITSFSCFYDLPDPVGFAKNIAKYLHQDGIWMLEQSYLPLMIDRLSYDTVCHEHLEYYGLHQIQNILQKAGLKILDVQFNDINGGSFCVTAAHASSKKSPNTQVIDEILRNEVTIGMNTKAYFHKFADDVKKHGQQLKETLGQIKSNGKSIVALGASTKGNVVLQYCNLGADVISYVGEVNPYKFGRFTPGTHIPIISEEKISEVRPDYKLILPWHFRNTFIERESAYLKSGGKLIFALPKIEIYSNG